MTVGISELATFGTFRDYLRQFASAFGVTESINGDQGVCLCARRSQERVTPGVLGIWKLLDTLRCRS